MKNSLLNRLTVTSVHVFPQMTELDRIVDMERKEMHEEVIHIKCLDAFTSLPALICPLVGAVKVKVGTFLAQNWLVTLSDAL